MKKMLGYVAVLFLNSIALFAQENQSVLWEISGKGLKKPSFLFGTYHVAPGSVLDAFPG